MRYNKLLTTAFSIFFLFSLFIHNHPFYYYETDQFDNSYPNQDLKYHSHSEFCSACRIGGNINHNKEIIRIDLNSSFLCFSNFEESLQNLDLILSKETRAPPYIS